MNRNTKKFLDGIFEAKTVYDCQVGNILMVYRNEKDKILRTAARFKDEEGYVNENLPQAKQEARNAIERAEDTFRKALTQNITGMRTELKNSISAPIPHEFTEKIAFYRTSGLTPTRTEAEALLELGQKSLLAIKALAKLLDDTHAPVRIETRNIEEFEKDIESMDDLTEGPLISSPLAVHPELVDILRGQPKPTKTAAGWREIGEKWTDSVTILLQDAALSTRLKALERVSDSWSADVTYKLREREHEETIKKEISKAEQEGTEYKPEETESSTKVVDATNGAVELAIELGRENARTSDEIKRYVK